MKVRTSITLSEELLKAIDKCAAQRRETRSTFIETALWVSIKPPARSKQNARDLEIINRQADFLNQEASEVLEYL
jgi:metal-responsive CopG/Arc/MetJ family transcriptional regulator